MMNVMLKSYSKNINQKNGGKGLQKGLTQYVADNYDDERQACDDLRKQMYSLYGELGIPENLAEKYWLKPANLAVVFSVDKVFVQTPGPDAGKQI